MNEPWRTVINRSAAGLMAAVIGYLVAFLGLQFMVSDPFWAAWGGTILIAVPATLFVVGAAFGGRFLALLWLLMQFFVH